MAFYEMTFIVRPDVTTSQVEQLSKKYTEVIKEKEGKLIKSENWGLRTLAYRVNKHRKGHYVMFGMEGNGEIVKELERLMRLSDDVIRFLIVSVEEMTDAPSVVAAPARKRHEEFNKSPRKDG